MTLLHQAAQKAVEALTGARAWLNCERTAVTMRDIDAAIAAVQSALQQQEEPSRELMEAYEGECSEATFQGFAESRAADKVNSLSRVIYRMGFQSGWEIRGKLAAYPSTTRQQEAPRCGSYECKASQQDGVICEDGECDIAAGHRAAAPSTPEKAGGVSDGAAPCEASERSAFEEWHTGKYGRAYSEWVEAKGRYAWDLTEELWTAWEAARALGVGGPDGH